MRFSTSLALLALSLVAAIAAPTEQSTQGAVARNVPESIVNATALGIDVYGPIPADAVKVENGHWSAEPGTLAHAWIKAQFDIDWSRVDAEQIAKRQGYANIGIGMFAQDWCKFHGQQRNITRKSYLRL